MKHLQLFVILLSWMLLSQCGMPGNTGSNQPSPAIQDQFSLINYRDLYAGGGDYGRPLWSPDGRKILLVKANNAGLYLMPAAGNASLLRIQDGEGADYEAVWARGGQSVLFSRTAPRAEGREAWEYWVTDARLIPRKDVPVDALQSFVASAEKGPLVSLNPAGFQLEGRDKGGEKSWPVTIAPGPYDHPLVAPGGKLVIAHRDGNMLLFRTDGGGLLAELGPGKASSWSADARYLLAHLPEPAGGQAAAHSELYLIDTRNGRRWQLTSTPDIAESWPSWNSRSTQVVFKDEKTGKIMAADLKLPH